MESHGCLRHLAGHMMMRITSKSCIPVGACNASGFFSHHFSCSPTTDITLHTAKQLINKNSKDIWLKRWATGDTGREMYRYLSSPDRNGSINYHKRKDQSTGAVFKLHIQHTVEHTPEQKPSTAHRHMFISL